jgi:hypothetical protein
MFLRACILSVSTLLSAGLYLQQFVFSLWLYSIGLLSMDVSRYLSIEISIRPFDWKLGYNMMPISL